MRKNNSNFDAIVMLGKYGPAFLSLTRACHRNGIKVYLIEISRKENLKRYSSGLTGGISINPDLIGTTEGLKRIHSYILSISAEALIALSDEHIMWLAKNRCTFEPQCKVLAPSISCLKYVKSKKRQIELSKKVGLDTLPTWYLYTADDYKKIPINEYPICIRPSDEDSIKNRFKVKAFFTREKLLCFLQTCEFLKQPIVAQPFLDLPNIVVHCVRSKNGNILKIQAFLVTRKFEGVTLSIQKIELDQKLKERCVKFAEYADIVGCFHFEFLYSEKTHRNYFLEVNVRLGGTTEKVVRMGLNEPLLTLEAYGCAIKTNGNIISNGCDRVVNKRSLLKHMFYAVSGKLTELDYPPVSRTKHVSLSLYELIFIKDSIFDWRDLRGVMWFQLRR